MSKDRFDEIGTLVGLDVSKIDEITKQEIDAHLMASWPKRGTLYGMYANSLMADFAPDFAKLHQLGAQMFSATPIPSLYLADSMQNIHSYVMQGWEKGIINLFANTWHAGLPKAQFMEIIMFTQLTAGMRGLGHVYQAIGDMLPVAAAPLKAAEWPEGWAADPDAFQSGMNLNSRKMSAGDIKALTGWYEEILGFVPNSILFGLKHHPEFVKVHRAKYEASIRTLPKQVAPMVMMRHHVLTGSKEGLREAVIHAKAWGVSHELIVRALHFSAYYFTGADGLYLANAAAGDLL